MEVKTQPAQVEVQEQLTPEYAARFLFQSFRHSQGIHQLQEAIFNYAHLKRPEWKISLQDQPKIRELARQSITNFLRGGGSQKRGHTSSHPT